MVHRSVLATSLVLALAAPISVSFAQVPLSPRNEEPEQVKPSLKDRFDQILATFLGDPSAGVDIDMKHVLDAWRGMGPKPLETLSANEARKQPTPVEAAQEMMKRQNLPIDRYDIAARDTTYPAADGDLALRIYVPAGGDQTKPRPLVIFFHGGGFVTDNKLGSELTARALAGSTGAIVVAPAYRLAPEAKFPAAQTDAFAAYRWILANVARLGGDPARIAIAGEGAGAMLAVDTCVAARDGQLAMPVAAILITPAAGIDMKTASYLQDAAARPWSQKAVIWAFGLSLTDQKQITDPRIDLVGRANLDRLPPTTIVTAEIDPLRSDGERLGGKLKLATVPVDMRDYDGVTHDFFGMGAAVRKAAEAQAFVADKLKQAFAPKPKVEANNYD